MGNLFSVNLEAINVNVAPDPPPNNFLLPTFLILIFLAIIVSFVLRHCRKTQRTSGHSTWRPPPTMMAIVLILAVLIPISTPSPAKRKIPKFVKPAAKITAPILASSALYLGLDSLISAFETNPQAGAIIATLSLTLLILFSLFVLKIAQLILQFYQNRSSIANSLPSNLINHPQIEMRENPNFQKLAIKRLQNSDPE